MKIDYQAEVLKVYPDAILQWHVTEGQLCGWAIFDSIYRFATQISDLTQKPDAWQSAYNKLIEQNKLTHKNE